MTNDERSAEFEKIRARIDRLILELDKVDREIDAASLLTAGWYVARVRDGLKEASEALNHERLASQ
jgi:hypothetical protein